MLRALVAASVLIGVGVSQAPVADAAPTVRNCRPAHMAGRNKVPETDPSYRLGQAEGRDGVACGGRTDAAAGDS